MISRCVVGRNVVPGAVLSRPGEEREGTEHRPRYCTSSAATGTDVYGVDFVSGGEVGRNSHQKRKGPVAQAEGENSGSAVDGEGHRPGWGFLNDGFGVE